MNFPKKRLIIDLDRETHDIFGAVQGDTDSRGFDVSLVKGGQAVNLLGGTVNYVVVRPDKTSTKSDTVITDYAAGRFTFEFTNRELMMVGVHTLQFNISGLSVEQEINSFPIPFTVRVNHLDEGAIIAGNDFSSVDILFHEARVRRQIEQLLMIADTMYAGLYDEHNGDISKILASLAKIDRDIAGVGATLGTHGTRLDGILTAVNDVGSVVSGLSDGTVKARTVRQTIRTYYENNILYQNRAYNDVPVLFSSLSALNLLPSLRYTVSVQPGHVFTMNTPISGLVGALGVTIQEISTLRIVFRVPIRSQSSDPLGPQNGREVPFSWVLTEFY